MGTKGSPCMQPEVHPTIPRAAGAARLREAAPCGGESQRPHHLPCLDRRRSARRDPPPRPLPSYLRARPAGGWEPPGPPPPLPPLRARQQEGTQAGRLPSAPPPRERTPPAKVTGAHLQQRRRAPLHGIRPASQQHQKGAASRGKEGLRGRPEDEGPPRHRHRHRRRSLQRASTARARPARSFKRLGGPAPRPPQPTTPRRCDVSRAAAPVGQPVATCLHGRAEEAPPTRSGGRRGRGRQRRARGQPP
ncbi:serine/arginine repetitive matrix protein 1-like [Zootoca vivipara]|uniref:serine/arginine repetitive matrix protein 1-like n=1 Tax=Zootoca vivipara TaxID=8524 RepID=UPI00293BB37A|nr:serine/arginine repetitive matrix protein 1-like [Zootoca vivipara]